MAENGPFNQDQYQTLEILERVGGSLSLFAVILLFTSYTYFRQTRMTPNTFIILASLANAGASIGHIVGDGGAQQPALGLRCQGRGFLLEWFTLSQALWSLAMAINVLLVLGRGPNIISMPKWGWIVYCSLCFGGPCVVALAFLLLRRFSISPAGPDEELCWISAKLATLRLSIPAWGCIFASLIIYAGVAVHKFRLSEHTQPKWECTSTRTSVSSHASAAKRNSDSVMSLSDWPLSTVSGVMPFGREDPERTAEPSPSVPQPAPAHTQESSGTWLSTFASSPRTAPTPPPRKRVTVGDILARFAIHDDGQRACFRTGLFYTLTLVVTWLPGIVQIIRRVAADTDPSYEYLVATAAVFPLQGIWNASIFFGMNWQVMVAKIRDTHRPSSGISGLLTEPGISLKKHSTESADSESDRHLRLPWKPKPLKRHPSWDFLDIGLEPRENERHAV